MFEFLWKNKPVELKLEKIQNILNYKRPPCQRPIDITHLSILTDVLNDFKPITPIYFCYYNGINFVIDGQHRLEIFKNDTTYLNKYVPVIKIKVQEEKEIYEMFKLINDNLPLPDVYRKYQHIRKIVEETYNYFITNYPKTFRNKLKTKRLLRPYIYTQDFIQQLAYILVDEEKKGLGLQEKYDIRNSQECIDLILQLNEEYSKQDKYFFNLKSDSILKRIKKNECHRQNKLLYLGLFKNDWPDHLLMFPAPEPMEPSISWDTLRKQCWMSHMGNVFKTTCWCCNINEITPFHFEAGHIKAKICGGKDTIENIRPICGFCNKSMGTMHMFEFMKKMNYNHRFNSMDIDG